MSDRQIINKVQSDKAMDRIVDQFKDLSDFLRPAPKPVATPKKKPEPIKKVSKKDNDSKTYKNKTKEAILKPVGERSTISANTYRQMLQKHDRRKKKYRNKSQVYTSSIHGTRTFDSIKEANYCEELDWRLKKGEITHYDLQPKIEIYVNGIKICNYYCDFRVVDKFGGIAYHEVKANITMTDVWRMKWKLVMALRNEILEPGADLVVIK